jgi:uncharacterized protein with GYD domain
LLNGDTAHSSKELTLARKTISFPRQTFDAPDGGALVWPAGSLSARMDSLNGSNLPVRRGYRHRETSDGGKPMRKYIVLVNFTDQGRKGVKDVPNRQDKSRETAKQFGVERKSVWMTFGPYDFVHLYEAPDDEAMAKFVMMLSSIGNVRTTVMRAWDESEHLPLIRELS